MNELWILRGVLSRSVLRKTTVLMQVPEDFDPGVLHPVNTASKHMFRKEYPDSFLERWLVLRSQVGPHLSSSHLTLIVNASEHL